VVATNEQLEKVLLEVMEAIEAAASSLKHISTRKELAGVIDDLSKALTRATRYRN
jgi:hypothetical protein